MKKILLLFLLIYSIQFYSQEALNKVDFLKESLKKEKKDTSRISIILKIAKEFNKKSPDSTFVYLKKALELSKKIGDPKFKGEVYYDLGIYYFDFFKYGKAIEFYEKALGIFEDNKNLKYVAGLNNRIGYCYSQLLTEDKAIQYYLQSLNIYQTSLNDLDGVAMNLIDIGNLYYSHGNYEFATNYFEEALVIYQKLEDKDGISICYINLGNSISEEGNYEGGLVYYFKSMDISKELKDELSLAVNYNNIGDSYIKLERYNEAISYFLKSIEIAHKENDKELMALLNMNMSDVYLRQGRVNESIASAHKSLKISKEIQNVEYEADNLLFLSRGNEKLGNINQSLVYLKKYQVLKDSLISIDKRQKVALYKALNDLEKNRLTINELSAKNELSQIKYENEKKISYVLIIAVTLFSLFLIIYINMYASRKKAYNLLEYKNYLVKTMNDEIQVQSGNLEQMNHTKDKFFSIIAHDLKNPFNSILGFSDLLIENFKDYDDDKKIKFLKIIKVSSQKASNLLSDLLLWANNQSGNLKFEPRKVDVSLVVVDVLSLVQIQAANKNITIYNNLDSNIISNIDENMISTVFRNLLSNAIKFTFENGEIQLYSIVRPNSVEICVKDNGTGIPLEDQNGLFEIEVKNTSIGTANEHGSGLGLILCKDFIEKHGGNIWVKSEPGIGSEFWFSLPLDNG